MKNSIESILDKAISMFSQVTGVNCIHFDEEIDKIMVGVSEKNERELSITSIKFEDFSKELEYYESPKIVTAIGDLEKNPPLVSGDEFEALQGVRIKGGMACGVSGSGTYGTVTMSGIRMKVTHSGKTCALQYHGISSNAHVIVHPAGKKIWIDTASNDKTTLKCYLSLTNPKIHSDIALAKTDPRNDLPTGSVLQIGRVREQGPVYIGMNIRKYGARTGFAAGSVIRKTNIRVNGRWFKNVFEISKGFGCKGDSGSPVIDDSNRLVGVFTWVEDIKCNKNPKGYFFATPPNNFTEEFVLSTPEDLGFEE